MENLRNMAPLQKCVWDFRCISSWRIFLGTFPTEERRTNPAKKSAKKSASSKIKISRDVLYIVCRDGYIYIYISLSLSSSLVFFLSLSLSPSIPLSPSLFISLPLSLSCGDCPHGGLVHKAPRSELVAGHVSFARRGCCGHLGAHMWRAHSNKKVDGSKPRQQRDCCHPRCCQCLFTSKGGVGL